MLWPSCVQQKLILDQATRQEQTDTVRKQYRRLVIGSLANIKVLAEDLAAAVVLNKVQGLAEVRVSRMLVKLCVCVGPLDLELERASAPAGKDKTIQKYPLTMHSTKNNHKTYYSCPCDQAHTFHQKADHTNTNCLRPTLRSCTLP